jgi:allantoinase
LKALLDAGVVGLKAFMCPSGISDFEHTNVHHFALTLPHLNARGALPLMVHAELLPDVVLPVPGSLTLAHSPQRNGIVKLTPFSSEPPGPPCPEGSDPRKFETYMRTRPREWEENAIRALIDVATPGSRVHIAHLADAQR